MAADKAGCLGGNVCFLEQPSTASSVRVGHGRWCMGEGSTRNSSRRAGSMRNSPSRTGRRVFRGRKSCTPVLSERFFLSLGLRRGRHSGPFCRERSSWRRFFPWRLRLGRWTSGWCWQPFLWLLPLGRIKVNGLRVRLCRRGCTIGDINVHPERPHYVHSN